MRKLDLWRKESEEVPVTELIIVQNKLKHNLWNSDITNKDNPTSTTKLQQYKLTIMSFPSIID